MTDRNCLSHWFPILRAACLVFGELKVPHTEVVKFDGDLTPLCYGEKVEGFDSFRHAIETTAFALDRGDGVFLRTGHTSGKHRWSKSCFYDGTHLLRSHLETLVEYSMEADFLGGLPTEVWVVRELLKPGVRFHCKAYCGLPASLEIRFFVNDGEITHAQPYWPVGALEEGEAEFAPGLVAIGPKSYDPIRVVWEGWSGLCEKVRIISREFERLEGGGDEWSMDLYVDHRGLWFVTDMALGARSFRYDPGEAWHP